MFSKINCEGVSIRRINEKMALEQGSSEESQKNVVIIPVTQLAAPNPNVFAAAADGSSQRQLAKRLPSDRPFEASKRPQSDMATTVAASSSSPRPPKFAQNYADSKSKP